MQQYIHKTFVISDREMDDWITLSTLLDRLGWGHYPEYVTGEDIDNGDDSEEACTEGVDIPIKDMDLWDYLDSCGIFDMQEMGRKPHLSHLPGRAQALRPEFAHHPTIHNFFIQFLINLSNLFYPDKKI